MVFEKRKRSRKIIGLFVVNLDYIDTGPKLNGIALVDGGVLWVNIYASTGWLSNNFMNCHSRASELCSDWKPISHM